MRRLVVILAVVLLALGAVNFLAKHWDLATEQQPVDFQINWVAAKRLVHGEALYDRKASKRTGLTEIGPEYAPLDTGRYSSFVGSPATALFYTPFTPLDPDTAANTFRVIQAVLMVAAIAVAGLALPRRYRGPAWLVGGAALLWFYPVAQSIGLGQVDGFIMLAIAVAIWASTRERWTVVGVALGVAALLKVSPGLLLIYLLIRGYRKVLLPAVVTAASLLGVAVLVGGPGDLATWMTRVVPDLSKGALLVNNQSLPAWLARMFGNDDNWLSLQSGLGWWRVVAWLVMIGGTGAVFAVRRRRPFVALELGAVLLVALIAGPLSWDHYPSWAILTLVLLADLRWWRGRTPTEVAVLGVTGAIGFAAMRTWTLYTEPAEAAGDWTRALVSGSKTVGLIAFFGIAVWLLARPGRFDDPPGAHTAPVPPRSAAVDGVRALDPGQAPFVRPLHGEVHEPLAGSRGNRDGDHPVV